MKLKYKIFISLITTACLILILVIGVMQFSIRKNFIEFVNNVEFGRQTRMLSQLRKNFEQNSGWGAFRDNPEAWRILLSRSRPEDMAAAFDRPQGPPFSQGAPQPSFPQGKPQPLDPGSLHRRLCLFDADKNFVAGDCHRESHFNYYPIQLSGQTIGWLGLENRSEMIAPLEIEFLEKQTQAFYIIGLGIVLLSLIITYIVSKYFLSPIRELANGTRSMRKFDFDTRINVTSSDELGDLAKDFNLMAQTLKQYETLRKNWISDISHELRTPVAVIFSKIEALQDGIRELTPELLDSLHRDITGLGKLINDLHQISLIDSENLSIHLKPVSVLTVFNQALESFLIRFEQQDIKIEKGWKNQQQPMVKGDAVLLSRVFSNLFENTLKYTDSPGILKLSCHVKENRVLLYIEDSSPGVPESCLESVFDRLYRVEQSRNRSFGGSGLGLSMAKQIITLHQGVINAGISSLGGLRIEIELPLIDKEGTREKKSRTYHDQ